MHRATSAPHPGPDAEACGPPSALRPPRRQDSSDAPSRVRTTDLAPHPNHTFQHRAAGKPPRAVRSQPAADGFPAGEAPPAPMPRSRPPERHALPRLNSSCLRGPDDTASSQLTQRLQPAAPLLGRATTRELLAASMDINESALATRQASPADSYAAAPRCSGTHALPPASVAQAIGAVNHWSGSDGTSDLQRALARSQASHVSTHSAATSSHAMWSPLPASTPAAGTSDPQSQGSSGSVLDAAGSACSHGGVQAWQRGAAVQFLQPPARFHSSPGNACDRVDSALSSPHEPGSVPAACKLRNAASGAASNQKASEGPLSAPELAMSSRVGPPHSCSLPLRPSHAAAQPHKQNQVLGGRPAQPQACAAEQQYSVRCRFEACIAWHWPRVAKAAAALQVVSGLVLMAAVAALMQPVSQQQAARFPAHAAALLLVRTEVAISRT